MAVYTSTEWHVKPGREQEFKQAWERFSETGRQDMGSTGWALLIQDKDDPRHFRSFGQWQDEQSLTNWNTSEKFAQHVGGMRELLDSMEVGFFAEAAHSGKVGVGVG